MDLVFFVCFCGPGDFLVIVFDISLPFVATMPALCASDFSGDFDAYLAKQDLPEGLIRRIINDLKISNVEVFANCVDSKEELMPTFFPRDLLGERYPGARLLEGRVARCGQPLHF